MNLRSPTSPYMDVVGLVHLASPAVYETANLSTVLRVRIPFPPPIHFGGNFDLKPLTDESGETEHPKPVCGIQQASI
jgi:hypothetical protein